GRPVRVDALQAAASRRRRGTTGAHRLSWRRRIRAHRRRDRSRLHHRRRPQSDTRQRGPVSGHVADPARPRTQWRHEGLSRRLAAEASRASRSAGRTMTSPPPVMIMVAPNGARGLKRDNAALPISPKEIADDVVRCAAAGASIAHLHARNPDGSPTQSIEVFREIVDRIREHCDIVLQISLGTIGFTVEQAIEPVALQPEMVSLPLHAFRGGDAAAQEGVRKMALHIRGHGVRPELSVYDDNMLNGALGLIRDGAIDEPACFGLIIRDPPSMKEGASRMIALADALPSGA